MSLAPMRLRADNFTPRARTPWGGTKIRAHYKAGLGLPAGEPVVGESWEVSVEPSFPSTFEDGRRLADVIGADPSRWLGSVAQRETGVAQTSLLVKLLDAADELSVQVHPADDDRALASDESGKPEAWVILEAESGAGLYLGFREGFGRSEVEQCIADGGPLDELMNFTPVSAGDTFVIDAGTPHAIGRGITLVEPQLVRPGRRGLTYRFWDWNRLYDEHGERDPRGQPRQLHLARSLAVTAWDAPRGDEFLHTCRVTPTGIDDRGMLRERLVDWSWFVVERWQGTGALTVETTDAMWALTCVGGLVDVAGTQLNCGQSAVVPAAMGDLEMHGDDALIIATRER